MSIVYSTRFVAAASSGALSPSFTVPNGFVAVVRDITVTSTASLSQIIGTVVIAPVPGGFYHLALMQFILGAAQTQHVEGRWVCNAGDVIEVQSPGAFSCSVSGYLLGLP